jgi:hypothetical protein
MYVNGKMIHVETVPGMERRGIKENCGGCEFKDDIFDILQELLQLLQCTPTQHNKKETCTINKQILYTKVKTL